MGQNVYGAVGRATIAVLTTIENEQFALSHQVTVVAAKKQKSQFLRQVTELISQVKHRGAHIHAKCDFH